MTEQEDISKKYRLLINEIDRMYKFYDTDATCQNYRSMIENIRNAQRINFELIRTEKYKEQGLTLLQINEEAESLFTKVNDLKDKLKKHLCENFKFISRRYIDFVEKLIDGELVDKGILEEVIRVYDQHEKGHITEDTANKRRDDYMHQRFNM